MTGPEHYREAERLLRVADAVDDGLRLLSPQERADRYAAAQVHAGLAQAAATIDAAAFTRAVVIDADGYRTTVTEVSQAWAQVLS